MQKDAQSIQKDKLFHSIKGSKVGVRYKGEKKIYDTNKSHLEKVHEDPEQRGDVVATVIYK